MASGERVERGDIVFDFQVGTLDVSDTGTYDTLMSFIIGELEAGLRLSYETREGAAVDGQPLSPRVTCRAGAAGQCWSDGAVPA